MQATMPIISGLRTEFCPLSLKPVSTAAKRGTKDTAHSAHRSPSHFSTSGFKLGGTGFRVSLITAHRFEGQEFAELAVVNCPNQPPESSEHPNSLSSFSVILFGTLKTCPFQSISSFMTQARGKDISMPYLSTTCGPIINIWPPRSTCMTSIDRRWLSIVHHLYACSILVLYVLRPSHSCTQDPISILVTL